MGIISVVVDPMSTKRQSPMSLATRADEADQLAAASSMGSRQSNPFTPQKYIGQRKAFSTAALMEVIPSALLR